jgi:hypothetical protein
METPRDEDRFPTPDARELREEVEEILDEAGVNEGIAAGSRDTDVDEAPTS